MPIKTSPIIVNIGPHHPSTHGVFRMRVMFDGENIIDLEPVFGYLHRGTEKLAEERTYAQIITLTDRLDYLASMSNNLAYVVSVEKLLGVKAPERAMYIRVIMAELMRIASHLIGLGSFLNDLGALATPWMYMFREREKILDLCEMVCGARITYSYMRVGGVSMDLPPEFMGALRQFCDDFPHRIDEYEKLLRENEILISRTKGVAVLSAETAKNNSLSGPVLRASGVNWDLRKSDPYEIYDRLDFEVPIGQTGDTYDRFLVRLEELRQSLKIINQCVKDMPIGETRLKLPALIRPPKGDAYGHVEAPKGELGFYIVSDGTIAPYRLKIRAPSFINLTALREMTVGYKLADLIVVFGSIDVNMGEVDR
ncbi:MAG: NADH-quinone oxidoreductase subunit D [Dehalococcoidia bacterium]|nr:NADH-quinone oxidoreductase subunit D [Dehalococcoidia bacterium]